MNSETMKSKIMRKVYFIWLSRRVLPKIVAEGAFFGAFIYIIGQNVFAAKVFEYMGIILGNNSINPVVWTNFAFNTFIHTELIVQLAVIGCLAMTVLLIKSFVNSLVQLAGSKTPYINLVHTK